MIRAAAAFSLLLLASCEAEPTVGPVDPASMERACDGEARALCEKFDTCQEGGVRLSYGTMDVCIERSRIECRARLTAPGVGDTPAADAACGEAVRVGTCADYLNQAIATCLPLAGRGAIGTSCAFHTQCASAFCARAPRAACGVCSAVPRAGDPCAMQECAAGQSCNEKGICQPLSQERGPCSTGADCLYGHQCASASTVPGATSRTCVPAVATESSSCDPVVGPQCDFNRGLSCERTAAGSRCTRFVAAEAGQPCGTLSGRPALCVAGAICVTTGAGAAPTCRPVAADGAACDLAAGTGCLYPARCVGTGPGTAGTCTLPSAQACR